MPRAFTRTYGPSTNGIPIRRRSTASTATRVTGRTRSDAAPITICSGPPDPTGMISPSWSPAAAPRRPPRCHALACGACDRHRLQRDERPLHRGAQAQIRLDNLEVRQLPIERAGELGMSFDQIVCTGPPSSAGPGAGLIALPTCSSRMGAMHLMVYAPTDAPASTCCRSSADGSESRRPMRGCVISSPRSGRCRLVIRWQLLRDAPDFRQEAALADALLHPQDRAYSVPQLFDFSKRRGLRFGRWVRQAPYSARCGVMAPIPQASRLAQLPRRPVRGRRTVPRHDGPPQRGRLPRRSPERPPPSASPVTPGWAMCRSGCRTPSACNSGCLPARRRS